MNTQIVHGHGDYPAVSFPHFQRALLPDSQFHLVASCSQQVDEGSGGCRVTSIPGGPWPDVVSLRRAGRRLRKYVRHDRERMAPASSGLTLVPSPERLP